MLYHKLKNYLLNLYPKLKTYLIKPEQLIILVGTHYRSYSLYQAFQQEADLKVKYFIDEEPWAHKTFIGEAQLRYPSELMALVKNNTIKAVVCSDKDDFKKYERYKEELSLLACGMFLCEDEYFAADISKKINRELC